MKNHSEPLYFQWLQLPVCNVQSLYSDSTPPFEFLLEKF